MNQLIKINKTFLIALSTVLFVSLFAAGNASAAFWAINENTGFDSTNKSEAKEKDEFTQTNVNTESLTNDLDVDTETGDNASDYNTGSGSTDSGLISVLGGFFNEFNLNVSSHTNSWWSQMIGAKNDTTGALSDNKAESKYESEVDVVNTNDANFDNDIKVEAETGENTASYNTGDGEVDSGKATSKTSEINTANGNSFISKGGSISALFTSLAKNMTTGYSSDNKSKAEAKIEVDVVNTNKALFDNWSKTEVETGENTASYNTGDGEVDSGNAEGEIEIVNDANGNVVEVSINGSDDSSLDAENDTTGAESDNEAKTKLENEITVTSVNSADFDNDAEVEAETGENTSSYNTGMGSVDSGNAKGKVMIDNGSIFNNNDTKLSFGAGMFNLMAKNMTTGFDSTNKSEAKVENEATVTNVNGAEVTNDAKVELETGDNEASYNTGLGDIETGDADAVVGITNDLNVNTTNIDWAPAGELVVGNDTTGAESKNEAEAKVENEVTITNVNSSTLTNTSKVETNTGDNTSSYNTGSGKTETGNSSVIFGFINNGNGNFTMIK